MNSPHLIIKKDMNGCDLNTFKRRNIIVLYDLRGTEGKVEVVGLCQPTNYDQNLRPCSSGAFN